MAGYFNSSRVELDSIKFGDWYRFQNSGPDYPASQQSGHYYYAPPVPTGAISLPTQSTTSWRTGGGGVTEDQLLATTLDFGPTTEAGVAKFLDSIEEIDPTTDRYDTGHTFSTTKHWLDEITHPHVRLSTTGGTSYIGPLLPSDSVNGGERWPSLNTASGKVSKYGPAAIAATAPTNPASTFGTAFFSTLSEGLPTIPKAGWGFLHSMEDTMRALAHGNLSVQFDWLPFYGDVKSTLHALLNASRILRQYQRDSGRMVRRGMEFPIEVVSSTVGSSAVSADVYPPPGIDTSKGWRLNSSPTQQKFLFSSGSGLKCWVTRVTSTRVWFKGAYSYFLPMRKGQLGKLLEFEEKANHLLGLDLTPELLWQLTPWSWLIDWKLHIGNSIKSFSALQTDGLVVRYGYLMIEQHQKKTVGINNLIVRQNGAQSVVHPSFSYHTLMKERFRATPYGFGIDLNSLTLRQWSILGALGMTRTPTSLRSN